MWMTTYWKGHHPTERKLLEQQRAQKYSSVYRNHREGQILNLSPPSINLVCLQGSIYPAETALWWCSQVPPSLNLSLHHKTKLLFYGCTLTFKSFSSTESIAPALHWQARRADVSSCPKLFYSVFLSGAALLSTIYSVTALCVGTLRMFRESELRKNIYRFPSTSQSPRYFPTGEDFAMQLV